MLPAGRVPGIKGNVFSKGRFLVGRTESCDFVIPSPMVSAVHAVIEITAKGAKIFDMNSKNGVYVNGNKVVAQDLSVGDEISIGSVSFKFQEYVSAPDMPPALDSLDPQTGAASIHRLPEAIPPAAPTTEAAPGETAPPAPEQESAPAQEAPYIVYPLSMDPKADSSEYIFEDAEKLYPIF